MGTASGTFLSSLGLIRTEDLLITALLATIGAIVSFLISFFLNLLLKPKIEKINKKRKR